MPQMRAHTSIAPGFVNRRGLLRVGALSWLGLNLTRLLEAESGAAALSAAPPERRKKSCILIYHWGGQSHLETWDPKPNAPAEVRGEFRPIATRAPGISISEHLPHTARVMDKVAIIRSLHHPMTNHNAAAVEMLCGRTPPRGDLELLGDEPGNPPCYGSALSFLKPTRPDVPSHVALPHVMRNVVVLAGQSAGFLGAAHHPLQVVGDPNRADFQMGELSLPADMTLARLENRRSLLTLLDRRTRQQEELARRSEMTELQTKAFDLLSAKSVRSAFDLSRESDALRQRYGRNRLGQSMLLARRLVEAGVRVVNVNDGADSGLTNWDNHDKIFQTLKNELLPPADMGFSALIDDLAGRGLLESTLVVAMGEFGRTPRINQIGGRDHWPACFSIALAGGGVRGGVVYGASDSMGTYPSSDPVSTGDLAATIYWLFGLAAATKLHDPVGRAYHLADGAPLCTLFH